VVLQGMRISFG